MRILILTTQTPFVSGGAEILADQLRAALHTAGHEAELVAIPFKWYPPERMLDQVLSCRLLNLTESSGVPVDRVIGLKFPAYFIPHPNKVLWLLHQHRPAYDLWDHPLGDLIHYPNGLMVRDAIRHMDSQLLPESKGIFTIAKNVSRRLKSFCNIDSQALYHPPQNAEQFYGAADEGYLFYPSRLCKLKRQSLVLEALAKTTRPVKMRFAGSPDSPAYAEELFGLSRSLGVEKRVEWLGQVTEEEKRRQFAHTRGVVFPPLDEDYGYITLEAMLSSKPVITCTDSGGPLEFVLNRETGLIADPTAISLATAMDELWGNPDRARVWGEASRIRYESMDIQWSNVVERLLA
jgi:glycosyltransferase involved in cell wall biosynthesis